MLLRSLYGATAAMVVPRRPNCRVAQPAVALWKFWTCSMFPPCHRREGPRFWQFSAVLRRSMTEPLRNHGDHGDATAVYAVQAPQWHRASGVTGVLRNTYLMCNWTQLIMNNANKYTSSRQFIPSTFGLAWYMSFLAYCVNTYVLTLF